MDFLLISGWLNGYDCIMRKHREEAGWVQHYTYELRSGEKRNPTYKTE